MKTVVIYTKDDCPECIKTKNLLKKLDIHFTERNIKDSGFLAEIMMLDIQSVPILSIGNTLLFGNGITESNIIKEYGDGT